MLHWQPTFCDFNIPPILPETKEPEVQKSDSTTVSHASQDEETNGLIEAPIVNDTSTSSPTTQIPEIPDSYTAITKSTTETSNLEKRPEQVKEVKQMPAVSKSKSNESVKDTIDKTTVLLRPNERYGSLNQLMNQLPTCNRELKKMNEAWRARLLKNFFCSSSQPKKSSKKQKV
uniref:Uncharacterized protein n=1 Tax=Polytomella parva TaxID=51329 RepID=A0A7S0V3W8_9CHLO|mmetsp:Transcript_29704/g.54462  ORF Transcript_29704/g.54462 Transcript_29704/m.54462 type:complete len:174 (+) Transcript_29704:59-580(+)